MGDDAQVKFMQRGASMLQMDPNELPIEKDFDELAVQHLIADFDKAPEAVTKGAPVAISDDIFNAFGSPITRDSDNQVNNIQELVEKVNEYEYGDPPCTGCKFLAKSIFSGGVYYKSHTYHVPAGQLGHYVSAGRHCLVEAGEKTIHHLDDWIGYVPVEDETQKVRSFGIKTVLTVPENHLAGAFRVGGRAKLEGATDDEDGEFVLLTQGRHVLDTSYYRDVVVQKLSGAGELVRVGPVTVVYIKEGSIGGCYHRQTGTFITLPSGPPYLLHEKDFEKITLKQRSMKPFVVGPLTFLTVKDGELGGAYKKETGGFELFAPGNTYQLHTKDYEAMVLKARSNQFKIGPYSFLTVQKGYLAGAYRKRGGDFVLLPPGNTYTLNEDEFTDPILEKRDRHVVRIGPYTFLTLEEGKLSGAYRTDNGRFEEFGTGTNSEDGPSEHVLHDKDYHGLTVVEKYSDDVQDFGPNKIVTIPDSICGVFEREGIIEIKEAGFFKVDASVRILTPVSMQIENETFDELEFRTKDSVRMILSSKVVWQVGDALKVAKWPGTQEELRDALRSKAEAALVMLLRCYNRAELIPTKQDVILAGSEDQGGQEEEDNSLSGEAEAMRAAALKAKEVRSSTEDGTAELLNTASESGAWGVTIVSVKLDNLELADENILADLDQIAQQTLKMKRNQAEGRAAVTQANLEFEALIQEAKSNAMVDQTNAEAEAAILTKKATADADVRLSTATAQAEISLMQATSHAKAQASSKKIQLEMQRQMAQSEAEIKETKLRAKQREAETKAASILAMAEAQYQKGLKEQEVRAAMPDQDLELERLRLVVQGMRHYGASAWRHPEEMQGFYDQMKPFLKLTSS